VSLPKRGAAGTAYTEFLSLPRFAKC